MNPDPRIPIPPPLFACLYVPRTAGDAAAVTTLHALAREFSPRVEISAERLVILDVAGLTRLLGEASTIGAELRRAAADRGLAIHVAIASTRVTAMLMALGRAGLTVVARGAEAARLAPLPIRLLERLPVAQHPSSSSERGPRPRTGTSSRHYRMAPKPVDERASVDCGLSALSPQSSVLVTPVFTRWGLKTLGELAALPSTDLFERMGTVGLALQRLARGADPGPLVPAQDPERFEATLALEWPIDALEPLSFLLSRLLDPVCAKLEQHDRGAAAVHVHLRLVTREVHVRRLDLPAPFRDPRVLRTLILLDLESHPPSAGIDEIAVRIDPTPGRVTQWSLLQRATPSPEDLSTLNARLAALMGEDRCGAPAIVDTHRPGAFGMGRFDGGMRGARGGTGRARGARFASGVGGEGPVAELSDSRSEPSLPSAFRRFRSPLAAGVTVERGRPVRVTAPGIAGAVAARAGPWRTSGDWWTDGAARDASPWNRDEWDVTLADGVYRLFRDRDADRWYVEGTVD